MANPTPTYSCYEIHFTDTANFPARYTYAASVAEATTKVAMWIASNYPVPKPGPVIAAVLLLGPMI